MSTKVVSAVALFAGVCIFTSYIVSSQSSLSSSQSLIRGCDKCKDIAFYETTGYHGENVCLTYVDGGLIEGVCGPVHWVPQNASGVFSCNVDEDCACPSSDPYCKLVTIAQTCGSDRYCQPRETNDVEHRLEEGCTCTNAVKEKTGCVAGKFSTSEKNATVRYAYCDCQAFTATALYNNIPWQRVDTKKPCGNVFGLGVCEDVAPLHCQPPPATESYFARYPDANCGDELNCVCAPGKVPPYCDDPRASPPPPPPPPPGADWFTTYEECNNIGDGTGIMIVTYHNGNWWRMDIAVYGDKVAPLWAKCKDENGAVVSNKDECYTKWLGKRLFTWKHLDETHRYLHFEGSLPNKQDFKGYLACYVNVVSNKDCEFIQTPQLPSDWKKGVIRGDWEGWLKCNPYLHKGQSYPLWFGLIVGDDGAPFESWWIDQKSEHFGVDIPGVLKPFEVSPPSKLQIYRPPA